MSVVDSSLPQTIQAKLEEGRVYYQAGQLLPAQQCYSEVLNSDPCNLEALNVLTALCYQMQRLVEAAKYLGRIIEINPNNAVAYANLGVVQCKLGQFDAAMSSYDRAIALKPDYADPYCNRGNVLSGLKHYPQAIASYDEALRLQPGHAEAHFNRANALSDWHHYREAVEGYNKAVSCKPDFPQAYFNRGTALHCLKEYLAAAASFGRAIALKPDYAAAYFNRGIVLHLSNRLEAAIEMYDKAIALQPDYSPPYFNKGTALLMMKLYPDAIASLDKAIELKPDYAEAYQARGNARLGLRQHRSAIDSFDKALTLEPHMPYLLGERLHTRMEICDWHDAEKHIAELSRRIQIGEKVAQPFSILAMTADLAVQQSAAMIWVHDKCSSSNEIDLVSKPSKDGCIRLGYFSADFHNHATSYLMAELFELHDRKKFEVIGFSFGPAKTDEMRKRLSLAFDKFIDIGSKSDKEVVELARRFNIDIAIDLKGFTQDNRASIFSHRVAPIQVSYLGYPGTMGAEYIDYLIADKVVVPLEALAYFTEKIAYLPNCYQVNDAKRSIDDKSYSREVLDLPSSAFVFCCFNNNYKITPALFDRWMNILKRVSSGVLWLLEDNPEAAINLRKEAQKRGVDPTRLVFAKRVPLAQHLSRHCAADLCLDTFPCNAHTTASDALWVGVPILTMMGASFASRVAASLLTAIGLPELIASTGQEYEDLAVELATQPKRHLKVRKALVEARLSTSLFNCHLFARNIETLYVAMHQRRLNRLQPQHMDAGGVL